MGTQLPDNGYAFGNDCDACENPGKLWDDGETPDPVFAMFWDVSTKGGVGCPSDVFPNGFIYELAQQALYPCRWSVNFDHGTYTALVYWYASYLGITDLRWNYSFIPYFYASGVSPCTVEITNANQASGNCYYGGFGKVWWQLSASVLVSQLFSSTPPAVLFDEYGTDDGHTCVQLSDHLTPMNLLVKFDPAA